MQGLSIPCILKALHLRKSIGFDASLQEKRELAKRFSDRANFESIVATVEESEATGSTDGKNASLEPTSTHTTLSRFMPTSRRIVQFSDGIPAPPNARIVYIDGAFDMFHPGHIEILKVLLSETQATDLPHARTIYECQQCVLGALCSRNKVHSQHVISDGWTRYQKARRRTSNLAVAHCKEIETLEDNRPPT